MYLRILRDVDTSVQKQITFEFYWVQNFGLKSGLHHRQKLFVKSGGEHLVSLEFREFIVSRLLSFYASRALHCAHMLHQTSLGIRLQRHKEGC